MENKKEGFHTLKGYEVLEKSELSYAMEDYLEMICRLKEETGIIRVNQIAKKINVKPSSASKMVLKLKNAGFLEFEPYGIIKLTQKGEHTGKYLLYRHQILNQFFCKLNKSENELLQVEKIEHFINKKTIKNMERWLKSKKIDEF